MHRWLVLATVIVSMSCSGQVEVDILENGQATVTSSLTLSPALRAYWRDLAELDPGLPADPLDPRFLTEGLRDRPDLRLLEVRSTETSNTTRLRVLSWSRTLERAVGPGAAARIRPDGWDLPVRARLFLPQTSIDLSSVFPSEGTVEAINQALVEILTPYATNPRSLVQESRLVVRVRTPKAIRSTNGRRGPDSRTAVWTFSVSQILQGNQRIQVEWGP